MGHTKKILLINPWIYDFAAYDLWSKPLGLLSLGGFLRTRGHRVFLIDCLDVHSPWMEAEGKPKPPRKPHHCGKFFKEPVEKPLPLVSVPRTYSRYGLTEKAFLRGLQEIERPDLVLVTSLMTYWYPGPFRVIELVKEMYPETTVILGGIYATLCYDHALTKSGADIVFAGGGVDRALALIDEVLNTPPHGNRQASYPVFDLYSHLDNVCLVTSRGCPYRCLYCASPFLEEHFSQRRPGDAVDEITHWVERFHVFDIAFYDDALSIDASRHFVPILRQILKRNLPCRFHLPNGIHARSLTRETAELMARAGFKTIRLGLETIDPLKQIETGGKVDGEDIRRAIAYLRDAGFSRHEVGVYLMAGLPKQPWNEVQRGIDKVWEWGATPKIAEYSPIPHTPLWEEAVRYSSYNLEREPLFQNNSLLPCHWEGFSWEDLAGMKDRLQKRLRDETSVRSLLD